jgi:outer membrane biosynthesis protein TonB
MADGAQTISMSALISELARALSQAEHLADLESARLAAMYKSTGGLADFPVPAFDIAEVNVELRFAVMETGPTDTPAVQIRIDPEYLKTLRPDQLSSMTLRFAARPRRVVEGEEPQPQPAPEPQPQPEPQPTPNPQPEPLPQPAPEPQPQLFMRARQRQAKRTRRRQAKRTRRSQAKRSRRRGARKNR